MDKQEMEGGFLCNCNDHCKMGYWFQVLIPAYQPLIGPMLNELCLGIQDDELAKVLSGVYAKDLHVRLAYLTAIKCIPSIPGHVLRDDALVTSIIRIALHDLEKIPAGQGDWALHWLFTQLQIYSTQKSFQLG